MPHRPATVDVVLSEYQSQWPANFSVAAAEIEAVFSGVPSAIEHIGSTSVVGLCAKPVIDMLLGVESLSSVEPRIPNLAKLGYKYRPEYEREIPERRYFVRPANLLPRIHLHAVEVGSRIWREHLVFRNALRATPSLAVQYARLKRELAVSHSHDKAAYTNAKAPFIAQVLASNPGGTTASVPGAA
jgi:GrpB-like predicted nucleotidyltransferase (UPF0157 family)